VEAGRPGKKRAKMNVCKICRLADPMIINEQQDMGLKEQK
jgi:hypothetical protein